MTRSGVQGGGRHRRRRAPARSGATAEFLDELLSRTPARVLVGRAGASYPTAVQLELREDHAAAVDAVRREIDLYADLGVAMAERWSLFEVTTQAASRVEHLMRPDLGRRLSDAARAEIERRCAGRCDLQIVIGDGLSATAVAVQAPLLVEPLAREAQARGWRVGQPFLVRYCRVGILNDIGALLDPTVVVLLIGERPGLRTAESLSAYMAYRPRPGDTDARRNLVCNIHEHGVSPALAVQRIISLAGKMRVLGASGVAVKEDLPG
jgi:ethanolamine ammonia-lyase small subunit